jgi:hypothetical protein
MDGTYRIDPSLISWAVLRDQPLWGKLITKRKLGVHIPF